ncbi:hypothetical protein Nepgr_027706 [Nepenthes gracilis]|uniref:Uncharacterized protein n=1 Tax=Nepenthes gracilis TaxID=150966 RepID=A0AAD3T9A3_NEPGR|nr:hypothetical protein Nepgr_027706 [Nepenthes gracilis]
MSCILTLGLTSARVGSTEDSSPSTDPAAPEAWKDERGGMGAFPLKDPPALRLNSGMLRLPFEEEELDDPTCRLAASSGESQICNVLGFLLGAVGGVGMRQPPLSGILS